MARTPFAFRSLPNSKSPELTRVPFVRLPRAEFANRPPSSPADRPPGQVATPHVLEPAPLQFHRAVHIRDERRAKFPAPHPPSAPPQPRIHRAAQRSIASPDGFALISRLAAA